MPTVRLPAPFLRYACGRSLMCCKYPVRAPCDEDEEARITKVLASSEAGRAYIPILQAGFESALGARAFKQKDEHCVHLVSASAAPGASKAASEGLRQDGEASTVGLRKDGGASTEDPGGCSLHFLGGLDALGTACRNYPRWITRLPPEPNSEVLLEAVFYLTCPTAARMLVADPSPFRFVEVPLETWPYSSMREATPAALALATPFRAGWWSVLADRRHDTERLCAVLDAMYTDPLAPPSGDPMITSSPNEGLLQGIRSSDVYFLHDVLERIPERGRSYASLHWELKVDLEHQVTRRELLDALDIAPELLAAFIDHMVPIAGLHDSRPVPQWLRMAVRRTIAVARLADALLARVPFGIDTLFGDLFTAAMHPDPMTPPTGASSSATLDKGVG